MKIDVADAMPDGWQRWLDWHRVIAPHNELEINAFQADGGDYHRATIETDAPRLA